jgi:hypothetical protein
MTSNYKKNTLFCIHFLSRKDMPISLAARSKVWVCGSFFAGIEGSNLAGGVDVCLLGCVLSGRGLCDGLIARPEES